MRSLRLFLAVVSGLAAPFALAAEVTVGILAPEGADRAQADWGRATSYLERALPDLAFRWRYQDLRGLSEAASRREIDFVVTNSGHYVELEAAYGAHRIATLQRAGALSPTEALASAIIVRAERSDLRKLSDLRGKRVLAVAENAFGGWQIARYELHLQGVAQDALTLRFSGFPMQNIVGAVQRGEFDAGVVRTCLLEEMAARRELRMEEFRVLGAPADGRFSCLRSTRLYPDWPFAALPHTPHALSKRVATALLSMPHAEGEVGWTVPTDYQPVHELFRELRIGPYASLQEPTLMMLAERYWRWVALLAALLAGWILYTVRVEHLVQSRTAELREALASRESLEARMRSSQEQADHMARLSVLGELSGTLAHELNQPLAAIGNYAQSLTRRMDNRRLTDEAVREAAAEIAGQAERAAGILGRIRGFAKKRAAIRERVAPREVAGEAIALFRGMLANAPAVELVDELPASACIEVDPLQIQEVLLNLLKNGYDAARELPPERQRLVVRIGRSADGMRFVVRDFGTGLDAATRERLFEPFFSTKRDGLGLGLSICRTIAEAHSGHLVAEMPADAPGSAFILSLPLAKEASQAFSHA